MVVDGWGCGRGDETDSLGDNVNVGESERKFVGEVEDDWRW